MDLICKKSDAEGTHRPGRDNGPVVSCRFYYFESQDGRRTGNRAKVDVEGEPDLAAVVGAFKEQGVTVTESDLAEAYNA